MSRSLEQLENALLRAARGEAVDLPVDGELRGVSMALKELLKQRSELVAGVAHEMKNRLMGISGFAQLGAELHDTNEVRAYLRLIEQDVLRANALLHGLVEWARPAPVLEPADLSALTRDVVARFPRKLLPEGAVLNVELAREPLPVRVDAGQLEQALLNLLMNASQAIEDAKVRRITVTTERLEASAVVRVTDSGAGFSAEARAHLFEAFFSTKPRGQGSGLGLVMTKAILLAHGGDLRLPASNASGAVVELCVPLALSP